MKLFCNYESLVQSLTDVAEVVEDKLSSEDLRNVIFRVGNNGVLEVIGINQLMTYRRKLPMDSFTYEGDKDEEMFQLRSKELLDYLNSYKNLRRTKIEEVSLETGERDTILCKVREMDTDTGAPNVSSWSFSNIPIKQNKLAGIDKSKPEETVSIDTKNLMFYTKNLSSLLQAGTNLYSHMCFGKDYVVVFCTAHVSLMKNVLGDIFSGVKLSYRAVSFLDKVVCREPVVEVGKDGKYIYLETETGIAYILYTSQLPDYTQYVASTEVKESGVVVDRLYFADTLRRLRLINEAVEFSVHEEQLGLRNSKFTGSIGVINSKAVGDTLLKFKVMPEILTKAVLGSDEEFSGELFFYFVRRDRGTSLVITDNSGAWFSVLNVKFY